MRGLWLENQVFSYRADLQNPTAGEGEALVRIRLAGICSTDLQMGLGYYPFTGIPGHEFVGEVVSAPGQPEWNGRRVVGEINIPCGTCRHCRAGRPRHCSHRTVIGIKDHPGIFAEYVTLPVANLHAIPGDIPDEVAVFTEPLAAALEIQELVKIQPGERILLVGAGRLGQLIAQSLALTGCTLQVVTRHPHQEALLAQHGINGISEEAVEPGGYDMVVDASGDPGGVELAHRAVRSAGTIVMKSTYRGRVEVNLSSLVVDEIRLVGSRCGPFEPAIQLFAEGKIDPRPLISARYDLEDGLQALEEAGKPGTLKVILQP